MGPIKRIPILFLCVFFLWNQESFAESTPPTSLEINPDSLRSQLLEKNLPLNLALKGIEDAKDQVSVARGNLLPSVNLGGMVSSAHTFLLSSIQFLFPFLLPSNWFNYKAQKNTFEAEKLSFYILELNTYSSALSLYYTMLGDQETEEIYTLEADAMNQIVKLNAKQAGMGTLNPAETLQFETQAQLAGIQASVLRGLAGQEKAALRAALALPITTTITVAKTQMAPPQWEPQDISKFSDQSLQKIVDQANEIAPERSQIKYLTQAAIGKKWSTVFGWINSATLGSTGSAPVGASLSKLYGTASLNLGASLYPTIKLANRNVEEIKFLDKEFTQSNAQVIESATKTFLEARLQYDLAVGAEQNADRVYKLKITNYSTGAGSFVDILVALTQKTQSSLGRVAAEENLNLQRIIFHRVFLTDQFAKILPCKNISPKGKRGQSLDQLCRS